jgi:hypothetical protein
MEQKNSLDVPRANTQLSSNSFVENCLVQLCLPPKVFISMQITATRVATLIGFTCLGAPVCLVCGTAANTFSSQAAIKD